MDPIQVLVDNWRLVSAAPLGTLLVIASGVAIGAGVMKLIVAEKS